MFLIKKALTPFPVPPGIFIIPLIIAGLLFLGRKRFLAGFFQLGCGLVLWSVSISPVSNYFVRGLESAFPIPENIRGDAIILLGAGCHEKSRDISGTGFPNGEMLARAVTAVRLHRKLNVPVIITSGQVMKGSAAGAPIVKRILTDLGVDEKMVIIEKESRDTYENAKYTKKICEARGFSSPLLVTSAYHLKRSQFVFEAVGMTPTPFPAYRKTWENQTYHWYHYLPSVNAFSSFSIALHEIFGLWYYRLAYDSPRKAP